MKRFLTLAARLSLSGVLLALPTAQALAEAPSTSAATGAPAAGTDAFQFFQEEAAASVPAMLTPSDRRYAPADVTVITAEDIKLTPARNLMDLLEVYVPGAVTMNHHEGEHVGMRGIMSDRNYKMLVLVNGVSINQSAHSGPVTELTNWDMNDIQKIEIIRGPGSVTYGPGAIECVISITTKNAATAPGLNTGMQAVEKYDSFGAHISDGYNGGALKVYSYASLTATRGFEPNAFAADANGNTGYVGTSNFPSNSPQHYNQPPLDYYRDSNDLPQGKAYLQLDYTKDWKFWARYTNSGTTENGVSPQVALTSGGSFQDVKENTDKQYILALENNHEFGSPLSLKTTFNYGSQDHIRRDPGSVAVAASPDLNDAENDVSAFSEDDLDVKSLLNYDVAEKYKAAVGVEYLHTHYGPAWGDSPEDLRMGETPFGGGTTQAILNGPDSNAISTTAGGSAVNPNTTQMYYVGDGWSTNTYSALSELNLSFNPLADLILSGRVDKNSYSQTMFSPRAALVSDWDKAGITKLIWQKSVRMTTGEQMLIAHLNGKTSGPETLNGLEFDYTPPAVGDFTFDSDAYYNSIQELGFDGINTTPLGTDRMWGLEAQGQYKTPRWTVGLNHAYVKQLSFNMAPGVINQGISYAEYDKTTGNVTLLGTGNDLNNIANNSTKLFANYKASKKLTIHADTRVFWSFPGAQNGLTMIQNAAQGTANQTAVDNALAAINGEDTYGLDWRLNVSVNYDFTDRFSINIFCLNLLGANGNKEYSYDAGVTTVGPSRVAFVEEPRVGGFKLEYKIF